jgi:putative aldouronate transport system permease protein
MMKTNRSATRSVHTARNRIRMTTGDRVYQAVIYTIVTMVTLACLLPLLYVIGMSFASEGEMIQRNYFIIVPKKPILSAYEFVFNQRGFWNSMGISVARTLLGVAAMLLFVIPGGYILSKQDMPGRKFVTMFFITTMLISGGMIPSYLLLRDLKLLNTFWVYVIPAFGNTYNMLIVKIFVQSIPNDIIESADLDGATELRKMLYIAIPLLVPTISALGLFAAVAHWNSWFDAMLYVRNTDIHPVQLLIRNLMTTSSMSQTQDASRTIYQKVTPEAMKMACVVVAMLPIMLVYPFLQKYFVYGMYTGSIKG